MKSESFVLEISLPAVDSADKMFKKISRALPKGSMVKLTPTDVKYSDVRNAIDSELEQDAINT